MLTYDILWSNFDGFISGTQSVICNDKRGQRWASLFIISILFGCQSRPTGASSLEPAPGSRADAIVVGAGAIINVATDCALPSSSLGGIPGCTDDAAAVQACLTDNPGRTFFFPKRGGVWSDYYIGSTLLVPTNVVLIGEGRYERATNLTFMPACSSPNVHASDSDLPSHTGAVVPSNVTIQNIRFSGALWCDVQKDDGRFNGNSPHVPSGHEFNGIELTGGWATLTDVYVCGFGQDGIQIRGDHNVLTSVDSRNNYRHGFYFVPYSLSPDAHVNVCNGCTSFYNQVNGFTDESVGNTFVSALMEGNYSNPFVTADGTRAVLISPWFEGETKQPSLGAKTILFGALSGTKPDWSRGPVSISSALDYGTGGALATQKIIAQEPVFTKGSLSHRTNELSKQVFGTGTPSGYGAYAQTSWYTRDGEDLGTVAFGETSDPVFGNSRDNGGWWCMRSWVTEHYDGGPSGLEGHPSSALCVSDHTIDNVDTATRAWLPHGAYLGDGLHQNRVQMTVSNSAKSGACTPGTDGIVYADSFVQGGFIGWVCTSSGIWRGFGKIDGP